MDKLWAPWRVRYVQKKRQKGCVFCLAAETPQKHRVIFRTEHSLVLPNLYPYNNGHMMVSPLRHVGDFFRLEEAEALDLLAALTKIKRLLSSVLRPQGFNIGINLSGCAGAGIPGHLHIHIVPRWRGDTNFMPVIYDTKVVSQSLDQLALKLKAAWKTTPKVNQE